MNRRFLQLLVATIIFLVFALLIFFQTAISDRLYQLTMKEFSRQMQGTSILMTSQIRSDLLMNDLRTMRVKLGLFQRQGIIQGYKVIRDNVTIDELSPGKDGDRLKFRQEIWFSEDGGKWGDVEYYFSTSVLDDGFSRIKAEIRYGLYFVMIVLLTMVGAAFSIIYYSALQIYPILDLYINSMKLNDVSRLVHFIWNPLIKALSSSTTKYEQLREESDKVRRSAFVGQITSQLSHDMRGPLGIFERLINLPDKEVPRIKEPIRIALNRLQSMIEALRYTEGENLIRKTDAGLDFKFGYESLLLKAQKRTINLIVPGEKYSRISIDHSKVERSWMNLASNAIGFARSFVKVDVEIRDGNLFIRVIDDGPGVPKEFESKLFQRGATHGKSDGTGLGLAYVRQIMRGHGGDVRYYRENDMTVFECFLPKAVLDEEEKEPINAEQSGDSQEIQGIQSRVRQISICFKSDQLNQRVHDRLSKITTETHSFMTRFDNNSSIVLTDFEEMAEEAMAADKRVILFDDSLSDDEIVRRAPIRLGLRG